VTVLSRLITLLTDFGYDDPFVGIMKGVVSRINAAARFIDLSHNVPRQNVFCGALILRSAVSYFPPGTIHVAVVDPGVGSSRRPLLIETDGAFYIGPDNGVLSLALSDKKITGITELHNKAYFLTPTSATFHGRDIFAPVAAHLSLGVPAKDFGPGVDNYAKLVWPQAVQFDGSVQGEIIYIDGYGNLVTNIAQSELKTIAHKPLTVSLRSFTLPGLHVNYSSGSGQDLVALINSWELLEIARFCGSAQLYTGARVGDKVRVEYNV
jgi:S-adenosyl-L-methionine hydrolase (adenosine-forming)